jgi:hypothetical protein
MRLRNDSCTHPKGVVYGRTTVKDPEDFAGFATGMPCEGKTKEVME